MNAVRLLCSAHTRSPMWFMWKIFIYNLLWLAEYQCKGVVKFNISDLFFFWGHFQRSWKWLNWKNLLLILIVVTRVINLSRLFHNSNVLNFQYSYIFFLERHYFLRSKSFAGMSNIRKAWRTERSSVVKLGG